MKMSQFLNKLSIENLEKIQKVLKIVLDAIILQGVNKFRYNIIPIKTFKEKGLYYEDVVSSLEKINEENNVVIIVNEYYREKKERESSILSPHYKPNKIILSGAEIIKKEIEEIEKELHPIESLRAKDKIDTNIIIIIKNLKQIKKIKKDIDKKFREALKKEFTKKVNKKNETSFIQTNKKWFLFSMNNPIIHFIVYLIVGIILLLITSEYL